MGEAYIIFQACLKFCKFLTMTLSKYDIFRYNSGLPIVPGKGPPPEEPPVGLCCASGCANCVWLEYAKELLTYYDDEGVQAQQALKKISDPSLKAFLQFEFEAIKKTKS